MSSVKRKKGSQDGEVPNERMEVVFIGKGRGGKVGKNGGRDKGGAHLQFLELKDILVIKFNM